MKCRSALGAASIVCLLLPLSARAQTEPIPPEVESAVDRGLAWLRGEQKTDGSWIAAGNARPAAITGLATMAFMARGHVPGQGPYGENINRAVDFVLNIQRNDGLLAGAGLSQSMYDHGICTIMLCESYGMLDERRQQRAHDAIGKAVSLILRAQNVRKAAQDQGGWRYTPDTNSSDISVSGWQLMALRGAANIGAAVPSSAINAGIAYIKRRTVFGGGFAYTGNGPANAARTGTGILSLALLGQPDAPEVKQGGDFLLVNPVDRADHYYYAVYYCSQAAWQLGGTYWTQLNGQIRADILSHQSADGAWPNGGGGDSQGGTSYSTAMAILALTVPYRYLPIYQR